MNGNFDKRLSKAETKLIAHQSESEVEEEAHQQALARWLQRHPRRTELETERLRKASQIIHATMDEEYQRIVGTDFAQHRGIIAVWLHHHWRLQDAKWDFDDQAGWSPLTLALCEMAEKGPGNYPLVMPRQIAQYYLHPVPGMSDNFAGWSRSFKCWECGYPHPGRDDTGFCEHKRDDCECVEAFIPRCVLCGGEVVSSRDYMKVYEVRGKPPYEAKRGVAPGYRLEEIDGYQL